MFFYLLLLFTILPALELMVLIEVGSRIGSINTIMIILTTGFVGAGLARHQGFQTMQKIQAELSRGAMPSDAVMDGLMILVGGILLLTPGFITDCMGILLLIPLSRTGIKWFLKKYFNHLIQNGSIIQYRQGPQPKRDDYDDIDIG